MALIHFENNSAPYLNADNLNHNFNECFNIIGSGSNSNGNYIKFSDGTMICTNSQQFNNVAITTALGSLYRSDSISLSNFPEEFTELKSCNISLDKQDIGGSPVWVGKNNSSGSSNTNPGNIILISGVSISSFTDYGYTITYIAIGKWK